MTAWLRPAGPADAEELAAVERQSWASTYAGLLPPAVLARARANQTARRWRRRLDHANEAETLLVVDDEWAGVVGFGLSGPRRGGPFGPPKLGEIYELYLGDAFHGHGYGTALMAGLARRMLAQGMAGAVVWAVAGNQAARRFYRALGGQPMGHGRQMTFGVPVEVAGYAWPDLTLLAAQAQPDRRDPPG